jgi:hypothetical protein
MAVEAASNKVVNKGAAIAAGSILKALATKGRIEPTTFAIMIAIHKTNEEAAATMIPKR